MGNKSKLKKILSFLILVALAVPLVLESFVAFPAYDSAHPYESKEDERAKNEFTRLYGEVYNTHVGQKSSEAFYHYGYEKDGDQLIYKTINEQFKVSDGNGGYKNMTDLNQMAAGSSMYVIICSNAYINFQGAQNPIGNFLKYTGYAKTAGDNGSKPSLTPIKESFYEGFDVINFVWRLEKLSNGNFQISSYEISESNLTNTPSWSDGNGKPRTSLTNHNGVVKVWPSGAPGGSIQQWKLKRVEQNNSSSVSDRYNEYDQDASTTTMYTIQSVEDGRYLNATGGGEWTPLALGGRIEDSQKGTRANWNVSSSSHRWSEWLVLPLLQDFDSSMKYGFTGEYNNAATENKGIKSTISSLSKMDPHDSAHRKELDSSGNVVKDALGREKLFTDPHDYGSGFIEYDTVLGYNITYNGGLTNGGYNHTSNGNYADAVNGRITAPEVLSDGGSQYMNLQCGDRNDGKNRILWTISPSNASNVYLSANKSFGTASGEKAYVTWANSSSSVCQRYFIFYSLNADGGYYMSPICFNYSTGERENFRVVDIAAYNAGMLQLWDFNHGSNGRFWINSNVSIDKLETEVIDVLVRIDTDATIYEVEAVLPYFKTSRGTNDKGESIDVFTSERYKQSLYVNSAFYNDDDPRFSIHKYENQGYYYAFDSANNVSYNNRICYRLFYKYISDGENAIVKNADAINTYYTVDRYGRESYGNDYKITDFVNGALPRNETYSGSTGVYAPFRINIAKTLTGVWQCWYVNNKPEYEGAKKIGNGENFTNQNFNITFGDGTNVPIKASLTSTPRTSAFDSISERYTELKIHNPTKQHNGLYFFCVVFREPRAGGVEWPETLRQNTLDAISDRKAAQSALNRLFVANNVVYHKVDADCEEDGILKEDWLICGTNSKLNVPQDGVYGTPSKPFYGTEMKVNVRFNANGYIQYASEQTDSVPYPLVSSGYSLYNDGNSETTGWAFFEATIKNPNSSVSHANYITLYKNYLADVEYKERSDGQSYWAYDEGEAFSMAGSANPLIHDTTVNLYNMRLTAIAAEDLKVEIFVDQFGTTFMAEEVTKNGDTWTVISAPKTDSGKNEFIKDEVFVAVAVKNEHGSSATFDANALQYFIKADEGWVDVNGSASKIKGIIKTANNTDAQNWYYKYSTYKKENLDKLKFVYALKVDTDDIIKAFGNLNSTNGLAKEFEIKFRCSVGGSGSDKWFDFAGGETRCGTITFIPFQYEDLT